VVRWLAGVTLACGMAAWLIGEPQSALAQSCSTLGIDPVTVTCSNPGGNIGTTNTTNVVSPNAATNDRIQSFNGDLIGSVTATTTVNGAGLNLVTTRANGGITMTNDGAVTTSQALNALQLNGNGGLITYSGSGSATNINNNGAGLAIVNSGGGGIDANTGTGTISGITLSTTGIGTINLTTGGAIASTPLGEAITSTAVDGLNTVTVAGGTIHAAGFGIEASSTGMGGVTVNTTGGQINGGLVGIVATSSGTAGDLHVSAGSIIGASENGVFASISNGQSVGAVRIDVNGPISASQNAVLAGGPGAVTVNVSNDITAGLSGVSASTENGLTTVNQTAGTIQSGGSGIDAATIGTGGVTVNMSGGLVGSNGNAVGGAGIFTESLGAGGDINVTARNIFSAGDGIHARIGNDQSAGNIRVAVSSGATVNVNSGSGVFAQTIGSGNVVITTNGDIHASNGYGIDAEIVKVFDPFSGTGNIIVINNANVVSGGTFAGANLVGGSANSLTNTASITGNVGLRISGGATSLTNFGTITGTGGIALQIDSGTLQLGNGNGTFVGNVVDNGVFAINRTEAWTFGGGVSGTGEFQQLGPGTTTLAGTNTFTGPTTVNGGALLVNGSIASSSMTTVNTGGVLSGNGIVGNTTINGGIFLPGNGVPGSAMTVAGNLAFQSGALYLVQINPAASTFASVTGTVSLNGSVEAVFLPGSYLAKQYTIVSAAGGVIGTFGSVMNVNLPSTLAASLSYDANNAYLNIGLGVSQLPGLNGNQRNVANAFSNFFDDTGGIPMVFGTLTPSALTQAAGETATGSQQTTFSAMTQFITTLLDPFIVGRGSTAASTPGAIPFAEEGDASNAYASSGRRRTDAEREAYAAIYRKASLRDTYDPRWSVWASGFGGSQTTSGNAAMGSNDTTSRVFGMAAGADYIFSPRTIAGFALAGGGTNFSVINGGTGRSDLFQAGAFVRHAVGSAYIAGALAYGWQDITTDRTVTIAGVDRLRAQFNANAFSGRVEGGYRFVSPWMGVTPYAAGQFTTFDLPAYAELVLSGANTFALAYAAKSVTASRSELGIRSDKSFAMQDSILTLRGRAAWAHDYNNDRNIGATFQTLPGASFVVNGAAQASDSASPPPPPR